MPGRKLNEALKVVVLDMQPIYPPVGGGRIRLLGLYHGLGKSLPTTYVGTYDWPGENYRRHQLSDTLEEVNVPLSVQHFSACADWQKRVGGKTIIDVSFPLLAHHSSQFVNTAKQAVATADIVIFSHPWIYPLVKDDLRSRPRLIIYDSQNVEGLLRAELLDDEAFGTELVKHVVTVEHELCHSADLILACSHEDRELFHKLYNVPFTKIKHVPNGTFTCHISPPDENTRTNIKQQIGVGDGPFAIFLGSAYQPNIEAAEFIINTLAPSLPNVNFAICGGVGEGLAMASSGKGGRDNVKITGFLEERDKHNYLLAADFAINPMFSGSGTNIKMFDFMHACLPIISTPIGARGIDPGPETPFLICTETNFVEGVQRVVEDAEYASSLGHAAKRLAEETYSWESISAKLGLLLQRSRLKLHDPSPFFSVIIASYERHDSLHVLLDCLQAQTFEDFEVIIVDQSDIPWERNGKFPDLEVVYIHTDIKGAVKARNTAAFYARGTVLAFTDDDCRPEPEWLEHAAGYFADRKVVGVEGLIVSDKTDDPKYRDVTNAGFEGIGFMTANLFVRHETFVKVNGFDERFDRPHFREDTDLSWRVLWYGQIPFAEDVRVYHPPHSRDIPRESITERSRFFEKDALLLKKHPERYRELFLAEGHYQRTPGFWENFLLGVEKYEVSLDNFYRELMPLSLKLLENRA